MYLSPSEITSARRFVLRRLRLQMISEPLGREIRDLFEGARLFEQMSRAGNAPHLLLAAQPRVCLLIQFHDMVVTLTDDQQRRRFDQSRHAAGQIWPTAARNDSADPFAQSGC